MSQEPGCVQEVGVKKAEIKKIIQTVGEFPTLPTVVARVLQILDDPNSSATHLTEIVSLDQAMMSRILKMANSAYYGFPRAVATVTESIVLLGFSTVRNLILTTTLYNFDQLWRNPKKKKTAGGPGGLDQRQEWKHAVATAVAARELLILHPQGGQESVGYLAGLMHDIGKQFFDQYLGDEYTGVLSQAGENREMLSAAERKQFGVDHGEVGSWIVDRWNLPELIVDPIRLHHHPDQAKENRELVVALHQADQIAHAAMRMSPEGKRPVQPSGDALDEEAVLIKKVQQEIAEIESFMTV